MSEILKEDLQAIEARLYQPRAELLKHRDIFRPNTNFPSWAAEVGYDVYTRTGSAKVLASGASATDIPFVGGSKARNTQQVFTVVSGVGYSKAEILAVQAARTNARGPVVQIDLQRVDAAKRFIMEQESKLTFVGHAAYDIKGVLDASYYGSGKGTVEDVTTGVGGYTWALKTPDEIIEDLNKAIRTVETANLFKARCLVLPNVEWNLLKKPYSTTSPMTILKWLETEGVYFEQIVVTNAMATANHSLGSDSFMVLDNDPEVAELATIQEVEMGNPIYNILGDTEMAVTLRTAGVLLRHPAAVYVGKKIG